MATRFRNHRKIGCETVINGEPLSISLRPETLKRINERIRGGEFESADAIVEQAVTFFLDYEEEEMDEEEFRRTKAIIAEALQQAERGESISLNEFEQTCPQSMAYSA